MFEKLDIINKNNQIKCGDYSLLFSMCVDNNEQHFN